MVQYKGRVEITKEKKITWMTLHNATRYNQNGNAWLLTNKAELQMKRKKEDLLKSTLCQRYLKKKLWQKWLCSNY